MCGRYALHRKDGKVVYVNLPPKFTTDDIVHGTQRFNIAPMQRAPVIAERSGRLGVFDMQWWLIPQWSKDGKIGATTFNAKAETLDSSKLFGPYFRGSRCLIPADNFYEWKRVMVEREVKGKKKEVEEKYPMCIGMQDGSPLLFAGLFSVWKNEKGEEFPSFTIITTEPNELMVQIHNRMPVILPEAAHEQWLDRENRDVEVLKKLLRPFPARKMKAYRVSSYVSNSRNEGPECVEEVKV